ncbi:serine threonine- kinase pim-2-like protein [Labeo rohita]|uniref:non-specific serine/threonine protein kinase n=1 Tax=Labeo rohita TaxID=84645 RepID=A0A498NRP3_LABRO|nr:serine threonine- kinase pim-2-like protein [Labeo rohita]
MESVHEPCVLLKYTSIDTAEDQHPHRVDKAPVGATVADIDGGRNEPEREEKKRKKSFWKRPNLRLFSSRVAKYDLAQAEKILIYIAPTSEVRPAAEEQQNVLDKGDIRRRYKIGDKLGQGRFGFVAVKFSVKGPNMPYIRVPGDPESVLMEIDLMLIANTDPSVPQIVKLLDWQDETDHYIMVMELPLPSMDLSSFVKLFRRKP